MLVLLIWISPLLLSGVRSQEDLEIVGSDNHLSFEHKTVDDDGAGDASYFQVDDFDKEYQPPKIDFPVKTVQRFTDADGNVKIVTSYSNRDDNPLPIYKDVALRQKGLEQTRSKNSEEQPTSTKAIPTSSPAFLSTVGPPYVGKLEHRQIESRARPTKQEYSATKTVKLPNQDGKLFANQHETSSSDGRSSSYNQKSSYKTNYKKPQLKIAPAAVEAPAIIKKGDKSIKDAPLEEAGSSYVSDIDESGVIDGPVLDEAGSYGGGEGYAEGGSSYSSGGSFEGDGHGHDGGPQVFEQVDDGYEGGPGPEAHGGYGGGGGGGPHGHAHGHGHGHAFKKGHGESHHHGNKASKGDKGGKGYKKNEHYEKGHAESHGHEAQKGGQKEESGGKTGHLDEGNHYAKGHSEAAGGNAEKKGHSKGHKKGHKTKGFRTVHHKDEYKKDEIFYDEEHDAGHHKGEGHSHKSHKHAKGGANKKGHLNSGYKHGQKGFKGDNEKGHSYKNAKGHSGSAGNKQHHSHGSHYDKAEGGKGGEAHGFEKKGH